MSNQDEFRKEATKHISQKTLADAVGLPDKQDKERIQRKLLQYEREHPGEITAIIKMAKDHFQYYGGDREKFGVVNKQAQGRVIFELPNALGQWFEQAYPLMFRDKKHTAWMARNFPELLIAEKY